MIGARVMDTPDDRKAHDRPTPKGGGVGVVVLAITTVFVGIVTLTGAGGSTLVALRVVESWSLRMTSLNDWLPPESLGVGVVGTARVWA